MKKREQIILITFGLFMTEAILHYNLGLKTPTPKKEDQHWLPPTPALLRIGGIVAVFSILNGIIVKDVVK